MRPARGMRRILHSIFTKLLVVMVLVGFCLSFLIVGFFAAYRHVAGKAFEENLLIYADYLIDDMGIPPSLERAQTISGKTGLAIHYMGPAGNWSTTAVTPDIDMSRLHIWHQGRGFKVGTFRGRHFMSVDRGGGRFTFEMNGQFADERPAKHLAVVFFVLLAFLLVMVYFAIRRILKPVRWLKEGVRQVGVGNLDHRVPLTRTGEFRDLAESFNTMTERVGEMMHAKERLLLDVSHELRSPITRMKVALEFMEEGDIRDSLREDLMEMEQMVGDILETYRRIKAPGALILKKVDLTDLIDDVAATFKGQPPGIQVQKAAGRVVLKLDPEKIRTVLQNLMANALKFSKDDADPVDISINYDGVHAVLEVRDCGIGIPEGALPYIFEPFYRVDASRSRKTGGYGLGLSLSKAIVEAHGGRIDIQSAVGRGTTVRVYLPRDSVSGQGETL